MSRVALALAIALIASAPTAREAQAGGRMRCPTSVVPLAVRDLPVAKAAVLRFVTGRWSPENGIDARAASARAVLARASVRGTLARAKCGMRTWQGTAVVFVHLPKLAWSASLSSAVFYASRVGGRWTVWFQVR